MKKNMHYLILLSASLLLSFGSTLEAHPLQPKVQAFISEMVSEYHFDQQQLVTLFKHVKLDQNSLKSIQSPYESTTWTRYRHFFVTPERIQKGSQYWQHHSKAFNFIDQTYGVSPSVVIAIIGTESNYGEVLGRYQVLDALSTLAFYYPPRSKFFTRELKEFLLLSREQKFNPLSIKGSYAGAIGLSQFMPSSYRYYAKSYKHASGIDLMHDHEDAIVSTANFLSKAGWHPHEPIAYRVYLSKQTPPSVISDNTRATQAVSALVQLGVTGFRERDRSLDAAVITLPTAQGTAYWAVFHNFNVIKRYNTSDLYAMTINDLSYGIRKGQGTADHTAQQQQPATPQQQPAPTLKK